MNYSLPHRLLLLLTAFLLSACASVGPDYSPPKPDLPDHWNAAEQDQKTLAESHSRWWNLFQDPELHSLINQAIAANQNLRIARSRVMAARAKYQMTGADNLPTGEASASYSNIRKSDTVGTTGGEQDFFQAGFDASWELDLFGGQRRKVEASAAYFTASEESLRDALISIEAEVARNYFELRGTQSRLVTAQNNLAAQNTTLAMVQGRFRLGLASQLEVFQAETQKSLVATQIPTLERKISQNINQLALLINTHPKTLEQRLTPQTSFPELPQLLPAGLPSDLLRRRPDIRRVERLLAAATAEVGIATAELFPKFSLSALIGLQSYGLADLAESGSRFWTAGPAVRLPIFNRGKLNAALSFSKATQEEMLATYEQTVLAALIETENALIQFSKEQQIYVGLQQATASGRQAATFAEGLYKGGLTDLNDVLTSQRTYYQTEDQFIQSRQQLAIYTVILYKALGGGWELANDPSPLPTATKTIDE